MKYLSKIVFINTADKSLRYAEVELNGNVHFIGTQGVGKSTLLRAILFFYNADTQKLGIPREKKNYNEYYFPFQNSYIIYEVQTETNKFCVLTFKTQGRVAFRFFNAGYDKGFFIDKEGKAFETWGQTRDALGKNIGYTRIVNSYEEYRNILYGNNKGLPAEFRKYALLQSKQYQNIPRTISNVFLNAKLDAEFVKQTIIKSLNEEEIKIDLTTYSQTHFKDFETNLNDIKLWTDLNRNGENQVEKQAEKVATTYSALQYLEQQKNDLAYQLGYALDKIQKQQPQTQDHLNSEELKLDKVQNKLQELADFFEKKKSKIQEQVGKVSGKLKDIRDKRKEYLALDIEQIIKRVNRKPILDLDKNNLTEERQILTSKFLEIQQRFDAQFNQLDNQLATFTNQQQTEKNRIEGGFLSFKDDINQQYDLVFDSIKKQNQQELDTAHAKLRRIETDITQQRIKRSEAKHKRFFNTEIEACQKEISGLESKISKGENDSQQAQQHIKNIQREWKFEEEKLKDLTKRQTEDNQILQKDLDKQISKIAIKTENSKDSLYGWLSDNVPDWDQTIGKVIDEDNVLFQSGLNPKKVSESNLSFYGIHLDTSEINKNVKTVSDLQDEKAELTAEVKELKKAFAQIQVQSVDDLEKLTRKFKPKIKAEKERIQQNKYSTTNNQAKLDAQNVRLSDFEKKAETEQQKAIELIDNAIYKLSEDKTKAEAQINHIETAIQRKLSRKRREKSKQIEDKQAEIDTILKQMETDIQQKEKDINLRIEQLKTEQKDELNTKGADTQKIDDIDLKLSQIDAELTFIENNRDQVAEYNKDKRELFDREKEFKSLKSELAQQLQTEAEKHKQQQAKLIEQITNFKTQIQDLKIQLSAFQKDLDAYDKFKKTELFLNIENYITDYPNDIETDQNCRDLINSLNTTDHTITRRYVELQEDINKFTGNFQEQNIFSFKTKFTERREYFEFAEMLKEFVDENKILEYKKRVEERFAHIIRQIGRETNALIEKEGEISKVITDINRDFVARQFVTAVKSVELKTAPSANPIFQLLVEIKNYNDEHAFNLGSPDLFSNDTQSNANQKAISLLKQLIKEMTTSREKEITLSDSFELLFKIVENDNDTGWVEKLTNVGSEGTDVLVKAMINIMLLNVFKDKASKKQKDDFRLHCMMDEIGKLHPNNVKGILKFANDRNILLINSSPTSLNATDYRYIYLLSKDAKNITNVKRLVKRITDFKSKQSQI